ncbi:MAG TPA: hypothetical protein VIU40_08830 [Geobacteraceae bacterium]
MAISKTKVFLPIVGLLVVIIAGAAGYTWVTLNWSFSSGVRAGYVQKFSLKGWLCKTWEGELSLVPVPGATPEKFLFSVRSDAVAQRISAAMGKKVSLQYEQHRGVPTRCFGETEYFVVDVKVVE